MYIVNPPMTSGSANRPTGTATGEKNPATRIRTDTATSALSTNH
jgi:hypothetical protein